ncbi:MAG TPA: site-2 protease family protein [Jiangellaceae bacterium]|nr:site-2 protease family protein [Jiangellaceae bacterium]
MRQSVRLVRVAGIPVGAHWSALIIAALVVGLVGGALLPAATPGYPQSLYWLVAVVAAGVFLAALLAHELAHAIVARRHGIQVRAITLWALGGVAEIEGDAPDPRTEFAIAVAGPLTSLGAAGAFWLATVGVSAAGWPIVLPAVLGWLAFMNVALAVFNLLPGAPLDGGRVLHAVLWWRYGDRARADQAAKRSGEVLGVVLIAVGVFEAIALAWAGGLWLALIGWFLVSAARSEASARAARDRLAGLRVRDIMTPHPDSAPGWVSIDWFVTTIAGRSRQTAFPVVDLSGAPVGFVEVEMLAAVPVAERGMTRVDRVAVRVPPEHVLGPDDPATVVLERPALGREVIGLVVDAGQVVGMLTTLDVARLMRQAQLGYGLIHPGRAE